MKFAGFTIIAILFILLIYTQNMSDKYTFAKNDDVLLYFPSGKYLSTVSLGFDQLLADLIWIKTTTYFATHLMTDKRYPWFYNMLDTLTMLDKNFKYPYFFGGIILALETNQIDKSNAILKKGMKNFPDSWRFPFYIGFNYFNYLKDPQKSLKYMEIAAKNPKAPQYIRRFPATLYSDLGEQEKSILFLQNMYNNTDSEEIRVSIKKKLEKLSHPVQK